MTRIAAPRPNRILAASVAVNVVAPLALSGAIRLIYQWVVTADTAWIAQIGIFALSFALNAANIVLFFKDQSRFRWGHIGLFALNGLALILFGFIAFATTLPHLPTLVGVFLRL